MLVIQSELDYFYFMELQKDTKVQVGYSICRRLLYLPMYLLYRPFRRHFHKQFIPNPFPNPLVKGACQSIFVRAALLSELMHD
jgi:hypothetical protein